LVIGHIKFSKIYGVFSNFVRKLFGFCNRSRN
jgi:hypothetical protein